jgi:hypothetical protein
VVRGTFSSMTRAIARRIVVLALALAALALALAAGGCSVSAEVSRELGARCDSADECDDRCLAPGASFPGGFCSVSCEASADCPFGASCADAEGGVCLFGCAEDLECAFLGAGWRCFEVSLREDAARKVQVCLGG